MKSYKIIIKIFKIDQYYKIKKNNDKISIPNDIFSSLKLTSRVMNSF